MDKWTDLFKWVVNLTPSKAIIAVLLGACIYFGWNSYDTNQDYKELFDKKAAIEKERNDDSKACNEKIQAATAKCNADFQVYRDARELELRQLAAENQRKLDIITEKLFELKSKTSAVEEKSTSITNKIH
jgi:hypothetical protein